MSDHQESFRRLLKNLRSLSFRGAAGDEESRKDSVFRARFLPIAEFTLSASPPVGGSIVPETSARFYAESTACVKFLESSFAALRTVRSGRANGLWVGMTRFYNVFQHLFGEALCLGLLLVAVAIVPVCCARVRHDPEREVWAKADGVPVYRDQVEALYRRRIAMLPGPGKPEQTLSFKLNLLNELIDHQILLDRAARVEITVSDAEVDARLAQIRSPYSGRDFSAELAKQGLTSAEFREEVRENMIIQKLVQKEIGSRVTVTEQEIAAYYAHNKANFTVPQTQYHLAQILVTPVRDPQIQNLMNDDARNKKEAERKIRAVYAQLHSGEDFAKVAEEYSEDPRTAQGGGDLGFIAASSLAADPALQRAVSQLKPGQFTGILHDRTGFRIVKLLGRVEAGERALSDPQVQKSIRKTLTDEKEELLKAAYVENLRDEAHVVNNLAREIVQDAGNAKSIR